MNGRAGKRYALRSIFPNAPCNPTPTRPPGLCCEMYYHDGELMRKFRIGRTVLLEYRLKRLILRTRIGGVILYLHSGVEAVLQSNYCKPHKFG